MRNNFDLMSYESFACKWPELKIDSPRFERPPRQAPSSERTTIFSGCQHIGAVPQLFETELMSWHGRNLGKPWYWLEASLPWLSECLPDSSWSLARAMQLDRRANEWPIAPMQRLNTLAKVTSVCLSSKQFNHCIRDTGAGVVNAAKKTLKGP